MSVEPKDSPPKAMDEAEPKADRATVPVLLIGLFALLFFWGLLYLDNHGGGFNAQVYQPFDSFAALEARNKLTHPQNPQIDWANWCLERDCIACHMVNGMGSTTVGAPPLAGSDWVNAAGPNRVIRIALNGLTGPVQVNGTQYGTGTMTPFKDVFKDDEIAAALTYVRQEWGNKAGPVSAAEVAAIRKATAEHPGSWTSAELLQIPEK